MFTRAIHITLVFSILLGTFPFVFAQRDDSSFIEYNEKTDKKENEKEEKGEEKLPGHVIELKIPFTSMIKAGGDPVTPLPEEPVIGSVFPPPEVHS